ncbi:solute carrier family 2 member 11, like isoform X2 [Cebidichthys violaceus]|uniref:solute carrier family 2 member 11, like isoform X2 n=1 Tax=Cebidichthys violaceus TaxID=271503 RepID=UPI0035CB4C37
MTTTRPKTQYLSLLGDSPILIAAIFVAGIGGTFQYGFCASVMTSPSARYSVSLDQWQVSLIWSFTVSIFCIGGLLGSLVSGQLISKYGRKQTLLFSNCVAISGAVLMLLSQRATSFEMIIVGRFLYGINSGVNLAAHTMYIIECAPKNLRGMVGVTPATFLSLGKFSGQLLGISELLGTRERWPWLLAFTGFTALLQLATLPFLPESPSFLLLYRGDRRACDEALRRLWGKHDYSGAVEEMLEEKAALQSVRNHSVMELIQKQTLRWQLLTIIVLFVTMQLCGISSVYFYSYDVFREAGIPEHQLRYANMGTGLCELATSAACFMIVENTGKKVLLFRGYMGMSATLILLTVTLNLQSHFSWMPYCSMFLVFLFIFFFAGGPAGVSAPLPSEMLTQPFKSAGNTLACTISWTLMFLLGILFPFLVEKLQYFCFLIFLFFCAACALYVKINVPETKNLTALEIAAEFQRMHCRSGGERSQSKTEQKPDDTKL